MEIRKLYSTQRSLKRRKQIEGLIQSILNEEYIEPILLSQNDVGTIQVENGHHQIAAYYFAGGEELKEWEYFPIQGESGRHRICRVEELFTLLV